LVYSFLLIGLIHIIESLQVTMPSEKEFKNPDTSGYIKKYLKQLFRLKKG